MAPVSAREKQMKENLHYITEIGKLLSLTARQKIAQRNHKEDHESTNRGKFLEILEHVSEIDDVVKQRLTGIQSLKYTSPSIQNEILDILADMVRKEICNELKDCKDFFALVDESKDVSGKKQMSLVARYLHNNNIHEGFLELHTPQRTKCKLFERAACPGS